jgi:hypothetical protein
MDTLRVISAPGIKYSLPKILVRLALSSSLLLVAASHAAAQYGGGGGTTGGPGTPGYTPPSGGYGSGKAIGIGVAPPPRVGVLFLALHNHGN